MLSVKKDYETIRRLAFTVYNHKNKKNHSVIYSVEKKEWTCDCTWNSLKETHCSHIKAVIEKKESEKAKRLIKNLGI